MVARSEVRHHYTWLHCQTPGRDIVSDHCYTNMPSAGDRSMYLIERCSVSFNNNSLLSQCSQSAFLLFLPPLCIDLCRSRAPHFKHPGSFFFWLLFLCEQFSVAPGKVHIISGKALMNDFKSWVTLPVCF